MASSYDFRESPMLARAMEQAWGDQVPHELMPPCVSCDEPTVDGTHFCRHHLDLHVDA